MKFISTAKVLTITLADGEVYQVDKKHTLYEKTMKAVKENDEKKVRQYLDKMKATSEWSGALITRKGKEFFFKGTPLDSIVTKYISNLMDNNIPADRFIKFLENLMSNPSKNSRDELWQFLQACQMPLDVDGNIIAYKWVNNDYTDVHSGKFLNKPGCLVEMPRDKCDDNRNNECSTGFHACSRNYTHFGSRLMEVRINPRDVVSVPRDYNAAKMRCCRYTVLCEVGVENYSLPPASLAYDKTHPIHEFQVNEKAEVKAVTKRVAKKTLAKAPPVKKSETKEALSIKKKLAKEALANKAKKVAAKKVAAVKVKAKTSKAKKASKKATPVKKAKKK